MNTLLLITYLYTVITMLAIVLLAALTLRNRHTAQNAPNTDANRKYDRLRQQYTQQIVRLLATGNSTDSSQLSASSNRRRMALAEALHTVLGYTYGTDLTILQDIVDHNRLDRFLLRRIALSGNSRQARLLTLISAVPSHEDLALRLRRYTFSRDSEVRISALTAMLAANPSMAIRTIAAYRYELTPFETARIIALLRRGLLPIAYEPLLTNTNGNLRLLGLAIVRNFGIEIAEKHLHDIISSDRNPRIVREAIYTLATLRRPLGRIKIRERLAAMTATQRKELCRHLTAEGYSLQAVRNIFSESECEYARRLINSYKRDLVCR